ncbi:MAG TPA: transposase [Bryobacteraceae bacterium]|nr:transposase [Bryobacteraceae bacterium]
MARKKKINKYPAGFRKLALERMKTCRNVSELSAELGIHRTQLYKWRRALEAADDGIGPPANSQERALRKEIRELKRVLGEKVLEADFFKDALQKVEARRQNSGGSGEMASSRKSES